MSREVGFETGKAAQKTAEKHPEEWQGILDADETILWQGSPVAGVTFKAEQGVMGVLIGFFFMGFSLFWMSMASQAPGPFWMFGLIFFAIGFYNSIGCHFWHAYLRSQTFYTLTSKRAFIAKDVPLKGRTLKSYPITDTSVLEFDGGDPATINFASEERKGTKGSRYSVDIGFERIRDGRTVMGLFRSIQTGPGEAGK